MVRGPLRQLLDALEDVFQGNFHFGRAEVIVVVPLRKRQQWRDNPILELPELHMTIITADFLLGWWDRYFAPQQKTAIEQVFLANPSAPPLTDDQTLAGTDWFIGAIVALTRKAIEVELPWRIIW